MIPSVRRVGVWYGCVDCRASMQSPCVRRPTHHRIGAIPAAPAHPMPDATRVRCRRHPRIADRRCATSNLSGRAPPHRHAPGDPTPTGQVWTRRFRRSRSPLPSQWERGLGVRAGIGRAAETQIRAMGFNPMALIVGEQLRYSTGRSRCGTTGAAWRRATTRCSRGCEGKAAAFLWPARSSETRSCNARASPWCSGNLPHRADKHCRCSSASLRR
jgi:hypothetical protein